MKLYFADGAPLPQETQYFKANQEIITKNEWLGFGLPTPTSTFAPAKLLAEKERG